MEHIEWITALDFGSFETEQEARDYAIKIMQEWCDKYGFIFTYFDGVVKFKTNWRTYVYSFKTEFRLKKKYDKEKHKWVKTKIRIYNGRLNNMERGNNYENY